MAGLNKMQLYRCGSCGGTYIPLQADGTTYTHACGPLPPDKNGVQLERPDKRDENIAVNRAGVTTGIKSEGQGARALTDAQAADFLLSLQAPVAAAVDQPSPAPVSTVVQPPG